MAGDLVDQMRFVLHVRMSFDQISKAAYHEAWPMRMRQSSLMSVLRRR
ncbi:hypothetical protein AGR9A_Cc120392 [Agrobacterium salinitolerans str. Hayward 0363]|nr:hypothetical protein AGR9A_Cc120392 [Agrobacterium salinitolerans str. Hayward 0363]